MGDVCLEKKSWLFKGALRGVLFWSIIRIVPLHYVHFVKYDDAVSFYDAVSDIIRRRG